MLYRRKLLLALLEIFGGKLERVQLQKLLLLVAKRQKVASFHFVPYKRGCYSFLANADLSTMTKLGQVSTDGKTYWEKTDEKIYFSSLNESDRQCLKLVKAKFGAYSSHDLIRYTYIEYPFYAINSQIATEYLSDEELEKVKNARTVRTNIALFTIGYEGLTLEQYLNKLIVSDVRVLCDVRNNPMSMKYGFSKSQLQNACEQVGIVYKHFPEVGIQSAERQNLVTQGDYDKLFARYKNENLSQTKSIQHQIFELLEQNKRIALTCFEQNVCQCHRKPLSEAIAKLEGWHYEIRHL